MSVSDFTRCVVHCHLNRTINFSFKEQNYQIEVDKYTGLTYLSPDDIEYRLVIVSPGYGAGFASPEWYDGENWLELATDARFIEKIFKKEKFDPNYVSSLGYDKTYFDFNQLHVEFIPMSCIWRFKEYDGHESIDIFDEKEWVKPSDICK